MPPYNLIKNLKLRQLLSTSESIQSRSSEEIQKIIEELSVLTEDEQEQMINIFQNEQKIIAAAKKKNIDPQNKIKKTEQNLVKVQTIKNNFDRKIRSYKESEDVEELGQIAQNLLKSI